MTTLEVMNPISLEDIPLFGNIDLENQGDNNISNPIEDNHDEEVPEVGMTFETIDELKQIYRK